MNAWDPTGEKARAVKARYVGVCRGCGAYAGILALAPLRTATRGRQGRPSFAVTRCVTLYDVSAARQFSARIDAGVVDRLERRGARSGLNKSRLAERYIDEGVRMDDHPGIVFRDGPTGRRAGLAAGPDVWEVIGALRSTDLGGDEAIQATAEWSGLSVRQVRDAIGYYSEYPDEIEDWIRRNHEEADEAERRWRE